MIGDSAKLFFFQSQLNQGKSGGDLAKLVPDNPKMKWPTISLNEIPLKEEDPRNMIRLTTEKTSLVYMPSIKNGRSSYFLVKSKMVNGGSSVFDTYEDFIRKSQDNKRLGFVRRYYNLNKEMFNLAKENPRVELTVGFDYLAYDKVVKSKTNKKIKGVFMR